MVHGADTRPVHVLYVGGMPRSGSTLTDLMLDRLPGHVSVGELFYLWRNGVVHDGLCACGEAFSHCPFWTAVGERAFGGWDVPAAHRVMALQQTVDATARIPMLLSPWRPPGFARAVGEYAGVLRALYSAIAEISGASVIVDSSKRPSLAFVLLKTRGIHLTVAQVVRDPRGVAYSFSKHVDLPPGAALGSQMPRSSTLKVSRRWVTVNALIGTLSRMGVPSARVRYEDLVRQPERELSRVAAAEGL
ncbi:MAG: sulfotransferase, partial [Actinomycetota bacterium]|nr:sulfotransferase [Actinomycetota bacterium]